MKLRSNEAEALVIGALLDGEAGITGHDAAHLISASALEEKDFAHNELKACFKVIEQLIKDKQAITIQNVVTMSRGAFRKLTTDGLLSLKSNNLLTFEEFLFKTKELHRLTKLRESQSFLTSKTVDVQTDPSQFWEEIVSFGQGQTLAQDDSPQHSVDYHEMLDEWAENIAGGKQPFIATGITILDEVVGGFVPNLNMIGGLPAVGKSALVAEIVYNILGRGIPCGFFGLEDGTAWMVKRHMARRLGLKVSDIGFRRLSRHQMELAQVAANELDKQASLLTIHRDAGIRAQEVVAKCKNWILTKGVKCIFIDHGGEIIHDVTSKERHDLAVAETYKALRDLAFNYKVPIVVLAHFNRAASKKIPTMQHFAESEYIARRARLALGLWRHPTTQELRCTVLKNTNGVPNVTIQFSMDVEAALVKSDGGRILQDSELQEMENDKQRSAS